MSTRADLLAVAEGLAAAGHDALKRSLAAEAGRCAAAAKVALEAAALVQDVDVAPAEHTAALKSVLHAFGIDWDEGEDPTRYATMAVEHLTHWASVLKQVAAHKDAHDVLRDFAVGMERDWVAADSDSSRRLAARARAALDEAEQLLGKRGV